ncbi:translation elongation factor EF-4 [Bradyrhizobium sp. AZCC 1610]
MPNSSEPTQSNITLKRMLLEMRQQFGKVDIPQEAFIAALKVGS